ncbi:MAG: ATP-dependent DNA helicase [Lactobacillus sp.]|jgi:ATP-dependent DNA helicase RecQ|nr:ATP-dependent DNA helicase [Lactobacillus sp.]
MNTQIKTVLKAKFGYDHFRPGQLQIIQGVLARQNVLGILPTGSGKSLCYQLPTYIQGGLTVVVSPLISLMQDQVIQLNLQGEKRVISLNSTLNMVEQQAILSNLSQYLFLLIAPETLGRRDVLARLQQIGVQLLVIDEAHCISQWGVDFRPSYLQLGAIRAKLRPKSTLMLTATATQRVQQDILEKLGVSATTQKVSFSVDRANIFLDVIQCADDQAKIDQLKVLLPHLQLPGIIYFASRQKAQAMAQLIQQELGIPTAYYHGALASKDRYLIQQRFMTHQLQVICATNAFGMGINKKDIRFVIHYHLPTNFESYLQEIGRAGRDGQQSIAIGFNSPADYQRQLALLHMGLPDATMIKLFYQQPNKFANTGDAAFELLQAYQQNGFDQGQVQELLQHKLVEKQQELTAFNQFIQSQACRRQLLLAHFGDELTRPHDEKCCYQGFDQQPLMRLKQIGLYVDQQSGSNQTALGGQPRKWPQILRHILE